MKSLWEKNSSDLGPYETGWKVELPGTDQVCLCLRSLVVL